MIYDTYGVKGNCRGCGGATPWHINGEYPICRDCLVSLIYDAATTDQGVIKVAVESYGQDKGGENEN